MNKLLVGLVIALIACGGSKDITPPPPPVKAPGTIAFAIDASSCTLARVTYFEIDSTEFGPETLAPGQTSKAYPTVEGLHATHARFVSGAHSIWTQNRIVNVPANSGVTRLTPCE